MDKDTYLILRVTGLEKEASDPLSAPNCAWANRPDRCPDIEYRVDAQTLDPQDYGEVRRDRQVAAIARPMPLHLIQPVAAPGSSAEPGPSTTPPGACSSPAPYKAPMSATASP